MCGICAGLLRVELGALALSYTCPNKAVPVEYSGMGLVSELGRQRCHCAVYGSWFMLKGKARKLCKSPPLSLERGVCACCLQANTFIGANYFHW